MIVTVIVKHVELFFVFAKNNYFDSNSMAEDDINDIVDLGF